MLTLKVLSEETERVVKGLEKKHFPNAREAVEKVLEYDKLRREAQQRPTATSNSRIEFVKADWQSDARRQERRGRADQS